LVREATQIRPCALTVAGFVAMYGVSLIGH
jgi:hypothetical protein